MKNTFWLLYRAQLTSMFWAGKKTAKKGKRVKTFSPVGPVVGWLVAGAIMAFYEFIAAGILHSEGSLAYLPPMVAIVAMLMTLLTTVSYAKVLLFEAKDHDMLFSLPISGRAIVSAKLAVMVTLDSILNIIMMVPCGIFYGIYARPEITFYLYYFILMLFVTFIPILFASVISALVSLIASRFRRTQFISIILYAAFLFCVMSISFTAGSSAGAEEEMLIGPVMKGFLDGISAWYLPLGWFMAAVTEGSLFSALLFVGASVLSFAVVALVFGRFYGKFHEIFRPRVVRRKYKTAQKSSGALFALVKKDFKHITSSANLFMNQVTGLLMLVVFAVMFSFMDMGGEGEMLAELFSVMFPFLFAMGAVMVVDTSTAISLEGKTFPLLKSLPVSPKTILLAKLTLHMLFCTPVILLCGIGASIFNGLPLIGAVATIVIPLCYAYTGGIVGLLINLKKYKFDWTNEITIAKNNLPMVLTMIGGMLLSIIPMVIAIILFTLMESLVIVLGIFMALSLAVAALMTFVIRGVGEKWFSEIEY